MTDAGVFTTLSKIYKGAFSRKQFTAYGLNMFHISNNSITVSSQYGHQSICCLDSTLWIPHTHQPSVCIVNLWHVNTLCQILLRKTKNVLRTRMYH